MAESDLKRVQVNVDYKLVEQADQVFKKLGMNQTTAITMFYRQVVRTQSIPFELKLDDAQK